HPRTVADAADMIEELGQRAGAADAGQRLATECRGALARTLRTRAGCAKIRTFCPIWRNPWMTFLRTTYIGDVLETVGLENIFGVGEQAGDFFEIDIGEALARNPEIMVLPDEPYVFGRKHG